MCIRTAPAPVRATTPGMAGSKRKALVSLTISAPASNAAWATAALVVSMEIRARVCRRRPSTTGRTRPVSFADLDPEDYNDNPYLKVLAESLF